RRGQGSDHLAGGGADPGRGFRMSDFGFRVLWDRLSAVAAACAHGGGAIPIHPTSETLFPGPPYKWRYPKNMGYKWLLVLWLPILAAGADSQRYIVELSGDPVAEHVI